MQLSPISGIGEIVRGADLAELLVRHGSLERDDVVVVTSKVVSKAEGMLTTLDRDSLLAQETDRIVARREPVNIVRTHHGLTMANAGIDASNVPHGYLIPLPRDPDASAAQIRRRIAELADLRVAVIIADTAGRAWRNGQVDMAIGCAGLTPLTSFAGVVDDYGNELVVTAPAIADELAAAAELASGKLGRSPFVRVRGTDPAWHRDDDGPGAAALIRDEGTDLFGLGAAEAVWTAAARCSPRGFGSDADGGLVAVDALLDAAPVRCARYDRTVVIVAEQKPIEAGALRERVAAVSFAFRLDLEIRIGETGPTHPAPTSSE